MYKQNLHNEILLHETSAPVWDVGSQTVFKPERNKGYRFKFQPGIMKSTTDFYKNNLKMRLL
jgi:hypothetical protein